MLVLFPAPNSNGVVDCAIPPCGGGFSKNPGPASSTQSEDLSARAASVSSQFVVESTHFRASDVQYRNPALTLFGIKASTVAYCPFTAL